MTMKKKILSAAVLAALGAGTAQAVNMGNDGTGQVLLFPYYTVQAGEETVLSVVNTTGHGKAVKVRFREAYNSREVLDFNVFLSPYDVWVGKVTNADGDAGGAKIITPDTTCTVPAIPEEGEPFRPYAYDGTADQDFGHVWEDTGPQGDLNRTNEGYVEIIEMGVMNDNPAIWDKGGAENGDPYGIPDYEHVDGEPGERRVPNDCASVRSNYGSNDTWWNGSEYGTNFNRGFNPPEGGMFGSLAIINVANGTEISVNATALEDVFSNPVHGSTGTDKPNLADADRNSSVLMNDLNGQDPRLVTDYWLGNSMDAVSAVLMADNVMNEYTVNPNVNAGTAWVVTFPTKWAYADQDGPGRDSFNDPTWDWDDDVTGTLFDPRPFTSIFDAPKEGMACEVVGIIAYDREEASLEAKDTDFSPSPGGDDITLCYEVNVIQFADSDVMSSANTTIHFSGLPAEGKNGWVDLNLALDSDHSMATRRNEYSGLPVLGFSASVLGNANVGDDAAANYGTSNEHVYHRTITSND